MKMDKGFIGGSTMLMLLSLLRERDYYGYEIIKEIELRSNSVFQFKEGTLYPVLHRMEAQGFLKSYKAKAETGKERKYYQITAKGKEQLSKEKEQWSSFTGSVQKVIGGGGYACT
nr:helix-turn-helix transcriptional regulator [Anaerotignum sp.]